MLIDHMPAEKLQSVYCYALMQNNSAPARLPAECGPDEWTCTDEERERADLCAQLAAVLPECELSTLRALCAGISAEGRAPDKRAMEIQKIYRLLQLLSLAKLERLYFLVLYM